MKKIIFKAAADGYAAGDIAEVENNAAHRYIDTGKASLFYLSVEEYDNRMVSPKDRGIKRKKKEGGQWPA